MTDTERLQQLVKDPTGPDLARHILEFDPKHPDQRVFTAALIQEALGSPGTLPTESAQRATTPTIPSTAAAPILSPIPWPGDLTPTTSPGPAPTPGDPLPAADVLVVTWTVAEAEALADVLTPEQPRTTWHPYTHLYTEHYENLIRASAPARQYGRLGVYATTRIGDLNVVCLKSDLHLSQDGPKLPIRDLWAQIITEVHPRLVITTGTAGGVHANTDLGDVIVTNTVRFDCQKTFATADFAHATYTTTSPMCAARHYTTVTADLFPANAAQVPGGATPHIWHSTHPPVEVVTTDFFAFDDTTDRYGLRAYDPHARAVEMGDAVLGLVATTDLQDPPAWVIVRNASDPQIDGTLTLPQQAATAARIYEKYGYWTTVNSAITTWALIADLTTE